MNLGGNQLQTIDPNNCQSIKLADCVYGYDYIFLKKNEFFELKAGYFYCCVLIEGQLSDTEGTYIKNEHYITHFSRNNNIRLMSTFEYSQMLIASKKVVEDNMSEVQMCIKEEAEIKKVVKPWGHELWLTGESNPALAFKKIFIKAGNKTSLQYHNQKRETNLLWSGDIFFHYKSNSNVKNDQVKSEDISKISLSKIVKIDIFPEVIHRIEAISDILLYEVSTPYLDDVIRVQDDSNRKDGRIENEHTAGKKIAT